MFLGGDRLLNEEEVGTELFQDSLPVDTSLATGADVIGHQDHCLVRPGRPVLGIVQRPEDVPEPGFAARPLSECIRSSLSPRPEGSVRGGRRRKPAW